MDGDDRFPTPPSPQRDDPDSTHVNAPGPLEPVEPPQAAPAVPPVLGVVVIYSETHESAAENDTRLGCVYPLREGEVLAVGRTPVPKNVTRSDGDTVAPTHRHVFPHGEPFRCVSRLHVTIELQPGGKAILADHSRYGIYLENAETWHRLPATEKTAVHTITEPEHVVLMDLEGKPARPDLADRRSHYRLSILHFAWLGAGARQEAHS